MDSVQPVAEAIAVITDIHANLPALHAALARIDELGLERVCCAGDPVGYGPHPNEVCALIEERQIPTIYGNYDYAIARDLDDCGCASRPRARPAVRRVDAGTHRRQVQGVHARPAVRPAPRRRRRARPPGPRLATQGQRVPLRRQARVAVRAPGRRRGRTRAGLRPHAQAMGPRLRRRALHQLRLGRQAQGRRPARSIRSAAPLGRDRRGHDRAPRLRRRGRLPRSPPGRPAPRVRRQAAGRGVTEPPLARRLLAEFLGSALLAALVIGSGIAAQQLSPDDTGLALLENAAATAAGLFAIILMFGPVSGGHFNPVVSLVDSAFGGLARRDALAYIPTQIAGFIAGAIVANAMFALEAISISTHHRASPAHLFAEVIATLGLVIVIFSLARTGRSTTAPAAVGAYIGAAYWFTSSTSFANPAITVGRVFSDTFAGIAPASVPGFVVAQLVGGGVAFVAIRTLYPDVTPALAADVVVPQEALYTTSSKASTPG